MATPRELLDQLRQITRSPQFAQIPDSQKAQSIRSFLAANNEQFAGFNELEQTFVSTSLLNDASPGLAERIGSVLPITGRAIEAFRGERIPGAVGLGLEEAPAMAGLEGFPGITPTEEELATRRRGMAEASPSARAATALAGELIELTAIFGVASLAAGPLVTRFMGSAGATAARAFATGSEELARVAAVQSFRTQLASRLTTDVLAGEMFGIVDAMETGEIRPLQQFIINPVAIAGLGLALFGAGRAVRRFGQSRVSEAQRFIQEQPGLETIAGGATRIQSAVQRGASLSREDAGELIFKVATGQATEAESFTVRNILRANPELLNEEFGLHLVRMLKPTLQTQVRVADVPPRVSFEDVRTRRETTQLIRTQEELASLEQRLRTGEIHITHAEGPEAIVRRFRRRDLGPVPEVMKGTEPLPTQLEVAMVRAPVAARPLEGPPTLIEGAQPPTPAPGGLVAPTGGPAPPSGLPTAAEIGFRRAGRAPEAPGIPSGARIESPSTPGLSPTEVLEREGLMPTAVQVAERRAARISSEIEAAVDRPSLVSNPDQTLRNLGYDPVNLSTEQRAFLLRDAERIADIELQFRGIDPAGMTLVEKDRLLRIVPRDAPPPPAERTVINIEPSPAAPGVSGVQGEVVAVTDPRGIAVRTSEGTFVTAPQADGKLTLPRELFERPAEPGPPLPPDFEHRLRTQKEVLAIRRARPGDPEQRFITTPHPETDTVTVTDQTTGESFTASTEQLTSVLQAGGLVPWRPRLVFMSTRELSSDALNLNRQLRGLKKADPTKARELSGRLGATITELQRRAGRLGDPMPSSEKKLSQLLKAFSEERGSVRFGRNPGEPIPARLRRLPDDNLIQAEAHAAGGQAFIAEDGRVVVQFELEGQRAPVVYDSELAADSALRGLMSEQLEFSRLTEITERAVENNRIEMPVAEPAPEVFDPVLRLDRILHGEEPGPINTISRFGDGKTLVTDSQLLPVEVRLTRLGDPGREMHSMLRRRQDAYEMIANRDVQRYRDAVRDLPPEWFVEGPEGQKSLFYRVIEDGEQGPRQILDLYRNTVRPIFDSHFSSGPRVGLEVASTEANYLPHRFPWEELAEIGSKKRQRFVAEIMKKQNITEGQAEQLANRIINTNRGQRISGALERDRLNLPGYVTNVSQAVETTIHMNARRLAEAQVFGPGDERILDSILKIRNQFGGHAEAFAREIFDFSVGNKRLRMRGATAGLYNWQTAKLSMSVLANSQQIFNAFARTNFTSFAKAIRATIRNPKTAAEEAKAIGAVTYDLLGDIRTQGTERFIEAAPDTLFGKSKRNIEQMSTFFFNVVEVYSNRTIATKSGQFYFDQQVAALQRNALDVRAITRLRELGITKDAVLRGTTGDLNVMRDLAGKRVSDATQFKADLLRMPLWANQSSLGRFVFQFKSFTISQARFAMQGLTAYKRGDLPQTIRTLAVLFAVYPVTGIGIVQARKALMGQTLSSDIVDRAFEDPTIQNWIVAGLSAMVMSGGLGIVADAGATALAGNEFALRTFAVPPAASSMLNAGSILGSGVRMIWNQDPQEFGRAVQTFSRELGGLGLAGAKAAERFGVLPERGRDVGVAEEGLFPSRF